jgi:hypothetical protein
MKNITKTQTVTLFLIVAYSVWEFSVWQWAKSTENGGAIIRVDLIIIYPILLVLIVVSTIQIIKKRLAK